MILPVRLQVLAPLQGGLPQQTGVIIQPQQIVLASGNKVQGNTQVSAFSLPFSLTSFIFSVSGDRTRLLFWGPFPTR